MLVPVESELKTNQFSKNYLEKRYPEFVKFIEDNYPSDLSWAEKLHWHFRGLTERPKCPVCGSHVKFINTKVGYQEFCSLKCVYKSDDVKERYKQTCRERYGVDCSSQSPIVKEKQTQTNLKKYGVKSTAQSPIVKEKYKQTCREKYGVDNTFQSEYFKEKAKNTMLKKYNAEYFSQTESYHEKCTQTNLKKYGYEHIMQTDWGKENFKRVMLEKYGVEHPSQTEHFKDVFKEHKDEIKQKEYNTKKKNHTFNTSKIEQSFKQWLNDNNISYEYQYKDDKYPFRCDFYFPDVNLYLEIQGHWNHGDHPFDSNNEDDLKQLEIWKNKTTKFYDNAIDVWAVRDPLKRQTAKENGLNFVEVFTNDVNVLIESVKNLII